MRERFIPYPLQNNIRHLPTPELDRVPGRAARCGCGDSVAGRIADWGRRILAIRNRGRPARLTFADWIVRSFGAGLARVFLTPYNFKVWATEPAEMSSSWVGERVATVDLKRILRNVIEGRDDLGWGPECHVPLSPPRRHRPNLAGDCRAASRRPSAPGTEVTAVDSRKKIVHLSDGRDSRYDWLITTMPLDHLLDRIADP